MMASTHQEHALRASGVAARRAYNEGRTPPGASLRTAAFPKMLRFSAIGHKLVTNLVINPGTEWAAVAQARSISNTELV